jgi:hypothetical protein
VTTQPTNVIDTRKLEDLRRELEGDHSPRLPEGIAEAVETAKEPFREVLAYPEFRIFIVGFAFGGTTIAVAQILLYLAHH